MIKSILVLISLFSLQSFAGPSDLNLFFQRLSQVKWAGPGSTQIHSGPRAGKYVIQVQLQSVRNSDGSWTLWSEIEGANPKPQVSEAVYSLDEQNQLVVTVNSNPTVAQIITLNPTTMEIELARIDSVTGREIRNFRRMTFTTAGNLKVDVVNLQDGVTVQDYTYGLLPVR